MNLISGLLLQATNIEMADTFRSEGKIYVVVGVIAIIFIGLATSLLLLNRRLTKLEKQLDAFEKNSKQ